MNPNAVTETTQKGWFFYAVAFTVYIIYSSYLDRFYVGYTSQPIAVRLLKHNSTHKGFTGKMPDWVVVYTETIAEKSLALKREKQIKAWKSKKMIEALIKSSSTE